MSKTEAKKKTSNVVPFPKGKRDAPPQTVEELKKNIEDTKIEMASYLAEHLTKEVFLTLHENGFAITDVKDLGFLMVTIKSMILRREEIEHPLQHLIDEHMSLD